MLLSNLEKIGGNIILVISSNIVLMLISHKYNEKMTKMLTYVIIPLWQHYGNTRSEG